MATTTKRPPVKPPAKHTSTVRTVAKAKSTATTPSAQSSPRDTSPTVAKTAARLMHDANADVRSVAASALAQVEHDVGAAPLIVPEAGGLADLSGVKDTKRATQLLGDVKGAREKAFNELGAARKEAGKALLDELSQHYVQLDADDLRATIIAQCHGDIAFNYDNEHDVAAALAVVAGMDGYVATANGLHVTVRRVVDG